MEYQYNTIECAIDGAVLTATINNPPVNVMTAQMYGDLVSFTEALENDDRIKVVVIQSANPDFFIAHFDVELILQFPTSEPPKKSPELSDFHKMCQRMRTMPKATIVKMAGRAGGGGNEFASNCDMRFGLMGKTIINQMEVALGILPGGTGTQSLPRLVGRSRAMEVMLGSDDIDAITAEHWGYLNRVFESSGELDEFVDRLAKRIAAWPREAIALCKASINNADSEWQNGMLEEAYLFQQSLRTTGAQKNMRAALEAGAQTLEGESRIADLCLDVATREN